MGAVHELLRPWYLKWFYFRIWPERRPRGFADCWKFPAGSAVGPADIVFLPMADWHGPLQRTQQLALALAARGHRCLYVNPHLGREFPQPYMFSTGPAAMQVALGVTELHVHLWREPVFHHRRLNDREEARVADAVAGLSAPRAVAISCFPLWNGVAERLRRVREAVVVYDCHDLIEGFGNVALELVEREAESIAAADTVVFSSAPLARRWGDKGVIIRNAGDPEHFRLVPFRGHRERPAVGYVGALNHWLDTQAIAKAAESRPDWDFVLIGPVDTADVGTLRTLPNVRLAGPVRYAELPQRLAGFDAVLIPFKLSPLIEAVNPVKLYEYLASGLPVVSSRLPEVAAFGEHVYLYDSPDRLAPAIDAAMREDSPERREARRAAVIGETWAARAEELERAIALSLASDCRPRSPARPHRP